MKTITTLTCEEMTMKKLLQPNEIAERLALPKAYALWEIYGKFLPGLADEELHNVAHELYEIPWNLKWGHKDYLRAAQELVRYELSRRSICHLGRDADLTTLVKTQQLLLSAANEWLELAEEYEADKPVPDPPESRRKQGVRRFMKMIWPELYGAE
jgi:hypothetical protein